MATLTLKFRALHAQLGKTIPLPQRMSQTAAGFDLAAALDAPRCIQPGTWELIPCGFAMQLPVGYEAQIRARSGLARRYGLTCLNGVGTIDSDYRGEVGVLLVNLGPQAYQVEIGSRIAQLVVAAVPQVQWQLVHTLSATTRDQGGFGSTNTAKEESSEAIAHE